MKLPSNFGDFGRRSAVNTAPQAAARPNLRVVSRPPQTMTAPANLGAVVAKLANIERRLARLEQLGDPVARAGVKRLAQALQQLLGRGAKRQAPSRQPVQAGGQEEEQEAIEPEVMPPEDGKGISPEQAAAAIEDAQFGEPDASDEFEAMLEGEDEDQ
ncbi:MAG: hypothetical protein WC729_29310 [Sphingomonas sp.]|jgi:hypothetical protein|uniref:hypothetical protein n=1 Tax=Sphingomonas sp. TaxID=28214 RepID=UPI0035683AB3